MVCQFPIFNHWLKFLRTFHLRANQRQIKPCACHGLGFGWIIRNASTITGYSYHEQTYTARYKTDSVVVMAAETEAGPLICGGDRLRMVDRSRRRSGLLD